MNEREVLDIIPGFMLDIRTLMIEWKKKRSTIFCDFKEVWKQLGFSLIHSARPQKIEKKDWTYLLYSAAYGFLFVDDIFIRLGSLYTLYLLYETQPHTPKIKVPVSLELWHELKRLQNQAIESQIKDCYAILLKMKEENAFCFTVTVTLIHPQTLRLVTPSLLSLPNPSETLNFSEIDTLSGVLDLNLLEHLDTAYYQSKLIQTPHTLNSVSAPPISLIDTKFVDELKQLMDRRREIVSENNETTQTQKKTRKKKTQFISSSLSKKRKRQDKTHTKTKPEQTVERHNQIITDEPYAHHPSKSQSKGRRRVLISPLDTTKGLSLPPPSFLSTQDLTKNNSLLRKKNTSSFISNNVIIHYTNGPTLPVLRFSKSFLDKFLTSRNHFGTNNNNNNNNNDTISLVKVKNEDTVNSIVNNNVTSLQLLDQLTTPSPPNGNIHLAQTNERMISTLSDDLNPNCKMSSFENKQFG